MSIQFNNISLEKLNNIPLSCKIMGFIIIKNMCSGIYLGISEFKSSSKPITNLYDRIMSNTFTGLYEALFWPISLPYTITNELDNVINYMRK